MSLIVRGVSSGVTPPPMVLRYVTTPAALLRGYQSDGFSLITQKVLTQIPGDQNGNPIPHLQLDAFEWEDISAFGIGNTTDALGKMGDYIRAAGSELWAYAMFKRTDVDLFGVKAVRYRLVLLHSQVQLVGAAVVILAIAFSAIIFWQYVTTGHSVALGDLQSLWGSAVTSVGNAGGTIVGGVTNAYFGWIIGIGAVAFGFSVLSKEAGVKSPPAPKQPSATIGVRAGPVSVRGGT